MSAIKKGRNRIAQAQATAQVIERMELMPIADLSKEARQLASSKGLTSDQLAQFLGYKSYKSMRTSRKWQEKQLPIMLILLAK